jgi:ABC-type transporter MlaC component
MKGPNVYTRIFITLLSFFIPLSTYAAENKESPLHHQMEAINRSFRQLNRQYADLAQKASSLELVAATQQHVEKAKTLTPPKAEKMSGDDQAKYVAKFHAHLDELSKDLAALKDAIASDKADITKIEIDKIKQLKD